MVDTRSTKSGCDRVTTIATLDGSLRTVELGTLEAIDICSQHVVSQTIENILASATDAWWLSRSDDELAASDARDELEELMRDTESAMYELGYLAYWKEGWFYIQTIDDDESDTE